jgi:hypothetical protein
LDRLACFRCARVAEPERRVEHLSVRGAERGTEIVHGRDNAIDLCNQWLRIDVPDDRQTRAVLRRLEEIPNPSHAGLRA